MIESLSVLYRVESANTNHQHNRFEQMMNLSILNPLFIGISHFAIIGERLILCTG